MDQSNNCLVCLRIDQIQNDQNPYFVRELESGYVVIGDHQFFRGYTLLLNRQHKKELHELDQKSRKQFLWDMSVTAEAVYKAFTPNKLNYELLGNTDEHMHWHLFPRHGNDPRPRGPVWVVDKEVRYAEESKPAPAELESLKSQLNNELDKLLVR